MFCRVLHAPGTLPPLLGSMHLVRDAWSRGTIARHGHWSLRVTHAEA